MVTLKHIKIRRLLGYGSFIIEQVFTSIEYLLTWEVHSVPLAGEQPLEWVVQRGRFDNGRCDLGSVFIRQVCQTDENYNHYPDCLIKYAHWLRYITVLCTGEGGGSKMPKKCLRTKSMAPNLRGTFRSPCWWTISWMASTKRPFGQLDIWSWLRFHPPSLPNRREL